MPHHRQHADAAATQRAYRARQAHARLAEQQAKGVPPAAPIPTLPSHARWQALIAQARLCLQTACDAMHGSIDDRSEAWQVGDRAATLQERLDQLEGVIDDLDALPPAECDRATGLMDRGIRGFCRCTGFSAHVPTSPQALRRRRLRAATIVAQAQRTCCRGGIRLPS